MVLRKTPSPSAPLSPSPRTPTPQPGSKAPPDPDSAQVPTLSSRPLPPIPPRMSPFYKQVHVQSASMPLQLMFPYLDSLSLSLSTQCLGPLEDLAQKSAPGGNPSQPSGAS